MDIILREEGVPGLIPAFRSNQIRPEEAINLSKEEWFALGVVSASLREKLQRRCRDFLGRISENREHNIVAIVEAMGKRRKQSDKQRQHANNNNFGEKTTRQVRVGWKHKFPNEPIFVNMTEKKGGGSHRLEIEKTTSLNDLEDQLKEVLSGSVP